jgi:hypothetical protein
LVEFNDSSDGNGIRGCTDGKEKHGCDGWELSMQYFGDLKQRQISFLSLSLFRPGTRAFFHHHALLAPHPVAKQTPHTSGARLSTTTELLFLVTAIREQPRLRNVRGANNDDLVCYSHSIVAGGLLLMS